MEFIVNNEHLEKVIFADGEDQNCDVVIPDGVRVIDDGVFKKTDIRSVVMPDTVVHINDEAFLGCNRLEKVVFSDNLEGVWAYAFSNCISLKEVILPASLNYIDAYAFSFCRGLERVEIPSALSISMDAFSHCGIKELTIPENVMFMEKYCFDDNKQLERVDIRANIAELPVGTFKDCTKLKTVRFPKCLTSINAEAFCSCVSLVRIEIPTNVTGIFVSAFKDCTSLKEVVLNEKLEIIDNFVFYGCKSLVEISIPRSVKYIGLAVFDNCDELRYIRQSHYEADNYPYYNVSENKHIRICTPHLPITIYNDLRFDNMILSAARGFVYMLIGGEHIDEDIAQSYIGYIKKNVVDLLEYYADDILLADRVLNMVKPPKETVDLLLEKNAGNVEMVAVLLKYKRDNGMTTEDYKL